jgi:hypothetical protein
MQGISRTDRDLWDAGEVTGHLVAPGSVFAYLAEHRRELFPDSFTADLFSASCFCAVSDHDRMVPSAAAEMSTSGSSVNPIISTRPP